MVDFGWKSNIRSPKSPNLSNKLRISIPTPTIRPSSSEISPASDPACSAYEQYLRLPELKNLWNSRNFPNWQNEPILKPGLQALELTFRFISTILSDTRPYTNQREWIRRLESLATAQIQIIAALCEDKEDDPGTSRTAPLAELSSSKNGIVGREDSFAEVWKASGDTTVISRISESSLLPRLATWKKSEDVAQKIMYSIECEFKRCRYSLGIGEPNLGSKPVINYDSVCNPIELRAMGHPYEKISNYENSILYTAHQILEAWIHASKRLLERITQCIEEMKLIRASNDCYILEKIWNLMEKIEGLLMLMDPADFLKLKNQLIINQTGPKPKAACLRSKGLVEVARGSKELRNKVPMILEVEVDPKGGPRIQEAAMKAYCGNVNEKVNVLQGLQAVEVAMKRFFFVYKQVVGVVMGSLEGGSCDELSQVFLEPTYFPSLDGAKTFLGDYFSHESAK